MQEWTRFVTTLEKREQEKEMEHFVSICKLVNVKVDEKERESTTISPISYLEQHKQKLP